MEQRGILIDDKLMPFVAITVMVVLFSVLLWLDHLGLSLLSAPAFSFVAVCMVTACAWKFLSVLRRVRKLNSGIQAEKAVGQFLEQFRSHGYKVLHDIPVKVGNTTFNIDHLLIGPKGIFTVETKSWRKPIKGQCIVAYDGQQVRINGHSPDRDPIAQALGQAAWVRDYLKSCTALPVVPITPIVVYPGWFIDYLNAGNAKVKVANEQLIWSCIQSAPHQLAPHDIKLVESRLTDYVQRQSA
jgi:hypothetical protein